MSTTPAPSQPDFNQMATAFDRFLPLIHPVTLALLDHLPPPSAGETVLDVACGTGEPGLTLARRFPEARLLGVDVAPAMVAVARSKAERESLANVRFEVMSSETLALADGSVDAIISRFGLLMFSDVPASARELGRALRPGGHFSVAVWDDLAKNTLMCAMVTALRDRVPQEHLSTMDRLNDWAGEDKRTRLLEESGLGVVRSEMFDWKYEFDDFQGAWDLLSSMGKFTGQATLSPEAQEDVKRALAASLAAYRQPGGGYVIPHACRLIWGQR